MRITFATLALACFSVINAADVVTDARNLLASREVERAKAERVLQQLPLKEGQPGWEERAFLFAELALKTDKQTFQMQIEQAFQILAEKATASWKQRGEIGLICLGVTDEPSRIAAIKKLDALTAELSKANDEATVDAAYALGLLFEQSANPERAISSFEHALKMLAYVKSYYGKDAYKGIVTEGLLRDGLARNSKPKERIVRKRPPPEEPLATFNRARAAQRARHHEKAIELFGDIKKGWPDHELAQASDYYEEECRVGLDQIALAEANLKEFIKTTPNGPWRGHANFLLGDLALERHFDPTSATPYFKAIIDAAASAHASWKAVLTDAHERYGILAYFREQYEIADRHLWESVRLRPLWPDQPNAPVGMAELRESVQAKKYPVPEALRKEGDEQTRFVLFLATAYMDGWKDDKGFTLYTRVAEGEFNRASFEQRAYALCMSARCQMRMDHKDEASKICDLFLKPPWSQSQVYGSRALMMRGNIASASADNATAVKYLQMVYTFYPRSENARWAFLGTIFHLSFDETPEATLKRLEEYKRRWPKSEDDDRVEKAIERCRQAITQGIKIPVSKWYLQLMDQGLINVEE